jgi:transposase
MAIVAGFDVHRTQITFDALDRQSGEVHRGRIPATPEAVEKWVARFPGQQVDVAVEACTGWLFVCEALCEAGAIPHLAEPVETSALRGKKATREDRPRGRPLAAAAALRGAAARGLDPAGAAARVAHPHAAVQDADR